MTKRKTQIDSNMPKGMRSSRTYFKSIKRQVHQLRGPFSASIMPGAVTPEQLQQRYKDFQDKNLESVNCVWCDKNPAAVWDHLNAIRQDNNWSGHWNSIENMVPACHSCNNARRNVNWEKWVEGTRPERLKLIQTKLQGVGIHSKSLSKSERETVREWNEFKNYEKIQDEINKKIEAAQVLADKIRIRIEKEFE